MPYIYGAVSSSSSLNFLTESRGNIIYCLIDRSNCPAGGNINGTFWGISGPRLIINSTLAPGVDGISVNVSNATERCFDDECITSWAQVNGSAVDTNETARFTALIGNCTGTDKVSGVLDNGTRVCSTDQTGGGGLNNQSLWGVVNGAILPNRTRTEGTANVRVDGFEANESLIGPTGFSRWNFTEVVSTASFFPLLIPTSEIGIRGYVQRFLGVLGNKENYTVLALQDETRIHSWLFEHNISNPFLRLFNPNFDSTFRIEEKVNITRNLTVPNLCDESSSICYNVDDMNNTIPDTGPVPDCVGGQTYQDGEGGCDVLSDLSNFSNNPNYQNGSQVNSTIDNRTNGTFLRLDTANDPLTGNLDVGDNNMTEIEGLYFGGGSSITNGTRDIGATTIVGVDNAWVFFNGHNLAGGSVSFAFIVDNIIQRTFQTGLLAKAGFMRNSQIISSDFGSLNGTEVSDCPFIHTQMGIVQRIGCNSTALGAALIVEGSQQIGHKLFVGGGNKTESQGIRSEGQFDIFLKGGADAGIVNGSLHIRVFRTELVGFAAGDNVTFFNEDFETGDLNQFDVIDPVGDEGDWAAVADANCFNDQCANAEGGVGSPLRIMEANFSTIPFNNITLNFTLTTIMAPPDLFNVTVNNNSGSGEVELFNTSISVSNSQVSVGLAENMNNLSSLSLRFYFQGNNPIVDDAFVNDIIVSGNATSSTEVNLTRQDAEIKFGDGTCTIFFNGSSNTFKYGEDPSCLNEFFNTTFISVTIGNQTFDGDVTINGSLFVNQNIQSNGWGNFTSVITQTDDLCAAGSAMTGFLNNNLSQQQCDVIDTLVTDNWINDTGDNSTGNITFQNEHTGIVGPERQFIKNEFNKWTYNAQARHDFQINFGTTMDLTATEANFKEDLRMEVDKFLFFTDDHINVSGSSSGQLSLGSNDTILLDAPLTNVSGNLTSPNKTCLNSNCSSYITHNGTHLLIQS